MIQLFKSIIHLTGILLITGMLLTSCTMSNSSNQQTGKDYYLLIGTYSPADSNGIFLYKWNTDSGRATFVSAISGIQNPSFLTFSPHHKNVYAVSETHRHLDGKVYAYSFDAQKGKLTFINEQFTKGNDPCNIITDSSGKWLFIANYTSGSLSVLPVEADGAIGKISQNIPHHGHSIVSGRQDEAHVHCAVMAPDNKDLFVTDLGMDQIFTYSFNEETGHLSPGNPPATKVTPGDGPRLMEFSPDGQYLYLITELGGQILVFHYQPRKLTQVQEISNLPENYKGKIWGADVHLSPDGKFLYAANRDDLNDIVTYKVNQEDGKISPIDRQKTGGKTPRNFTISPDGRYIFIGHQNSKEITIFKRDTQTGMLTPMEEQIPVAHAVCLKMIPVE